MKFTKDNYTNIRYTTASSVLMQHTKPSSRLTLSTAQNRIWDGKGTPWLILYPSGCCFDHVRGWVQFHLFGLFGCQADFLASFADWVHPGLNHCLSDCQLDLVVTGLFLPWSAQSELVFIDSAGLALLGTWTLPSFLPFCGSTARRTMEMSG